MKLTGTVDAAHKRPHVGCCTRPGDEREATAAVPGGFPGTLGGGEEIPRAGDDRPCVKEHDVLTGQHAYRSRKPLRQGDTDRPRARDSAERLRDAQADRLQLVAGRSRDDLPVFQESVQKPGRQADGRGNEYRRGSGGRPEESAVHRFGVRLHAFNRRSGPLSVDTELTHKIFNAGL